MTDLEVKTTPFNQEVKELTFQRRAVWELGRKIRGRKIFDRDYHLR